MQEPPNTETRYLGKDGPAFRCGMKHSTIGGREYILPPICLSASTITILIKKEKVMNKISTISYYLWAVFAILAFVSAWWLPTWAAVIQWIFGGMNLLSIAAVAIDKIETRKKNKQEKVQEE